jgi:hypothetical protein
VANAALGLISGNFFVELKRRNVYKVGVAYIVAGWALSQGIAQVFPVFDVPNRVVRLLVLLIIVGLPVALVLACMFEIMPQGIKRTEMADAMRGTTQRKKYAWIYVVVIGGLLSIGLFFLGRHTAQTPERAYQRGDTNYLFVVRVDPMLDDLRGHPRFDALVQKIVGGK